MALDVAEREARVKYLQARHALLEKQGEYDDLSYTLRDVIGLPVGTTLQLQVPAAVEARPAALESYVADALNENPDVLEARALVKKASHGVGAARADYIPQLGLMGMHIYQNSVPFFPKNTLAVGAVGSFTLFVQGRREGVFRDVDPLLTYLTILPPILIFFARQRVVAGQRKNVQGFAAAAPRDIDQFKRHMQESARALLRRQR
jgi:hypothetical protein